MRPAHHHPRPPEVAHAPVDCDRLQADLSAMIDGELAPAATREVMVHADACTECGGFLTALLTQQRIHRALAAGVLRTDQQPALAAAACLPCEAMARGLPRLVSERGALARRP